MPKVKCAGCGERIERSEALRRGIQSFCDGSCVAILADRRKAFSGPVRRSGGNPMPSGLRDEVVASDGARCRACGTRQNLHVHHVRYRSEGGKHEKSNLVTLCLHCHDMVHSNKRLYQPALLRLVAERDNSSDKLIRLKDFLDE